jgi:hypothetical protein
MWSNNEEITLQILSILLLNLCLFIDNHFRQIDYQSINQYGFPRVGRASLFPIKSIICGIGVQK